MSLGPRTRGILATILLVLGIGLAIARVGLLTEVAGVRLSATWAMTDFFSGAYYPVRAVLAGENPYDRARFVALYPVDGQYGLFLPFNFVLHLPFGLLPPVTAGAVYFVCTIGLMALLAYVSLRENRLPAGGTVVVFLTALILMSRPGHWSLVLGQPAVLLTVASCLALMYARRSPGASGAALALAMLKPTYGAPLAILMLARGYRKAVLLGGIFAAMVNLPLVMLLAARHGGLRRFTQVVLTGYHDFQADSPDAGPSTSALRIDAVSFSSRFLGHPLSGTAQVAFGILLLGVTAAVLHGLSRRREATPPTITLGLISLTMLLCVYHLGYDMVLLTSPFISLVAHGLPALPGGRVLRRLFIVLFTIPLINWASTASVLTAVQPTHSVWLVITSINGACLLALFVGYLWCALRYQEHSAASEVMESGSSRLADHPTPTSRPAADSGGGGSPTHTPVRWS